MFKLFNNKKNSLKMLCTCLSSLGQKITKVQRSIWVFDESCSSGVNSVLDDSHCNWPKFKLMLLVFTFKDWWPTFHFKSTVGTGRKLGLSFGHVWSYLTYCIVCDEAIPMAFYFQVNPSLSAPVVLFTYYNPILKRGMDTFLKAVKEAGGSGSDFSLNIIRIKTVNLLLSLEKQWRITSFT